jgi:hypothetical protein
MSGPVRNILPMLLFIPSVWTNLAAGRPSKQYAGARGGFGLATGGYFEKGIAAQEVALIAAVWGGVGNAAPLCCADFHGPFGLPSGAGA